MSTLSQTPLPLQNEIPHLATSSVHFSRILVATDFSKASEQAVKTAISISQLFGSKLFLLHAASLFVATIDEATPMPAALLNANLAAARQQMQGLILSDPRLRKRQPETIIACTDPVDLIQEAAHQEKIDLIIVGSHGPSGIERIALGSVAETVLRKSTCPVLIVGPNCKAEADPFCSILFATDLATSSLRAAQYAASLAGNAHGKLTLLHVIEKRGTWPMLPPNPACDLGEEELLEELLPPNAAQHFHPRVRVEYGPVAEIITSVAKEECAGLVVVGLKDSSAFAHRAPWSTLSHLIHNLHCPVLGVRGHVA